MQLSVKETTAPSTPKVEIISKKVKKTAKSSTSNAGQKYTAKSLTTKSGIRTLALKDKEAL